MSEWRPNVAKLPEHKRPRYVCGKCHAKFFDTEKGRCPFCATDAVKPMKGGGKSSKSDDAAE